MTSQLTGGAAKYVLEADIVSFFDSIDRKMLMEMLRERIADETMMRLVDKCLHVGVLEGAEYSEPENGTTQGSVLSPLLGNIYLHNVLDEWFEVLGDVPASRPRSPKPHPLPVALPAVRTARALLTPSNLAQTWNRELTTRSGSGRSSDRH